MVRAFFALLVGVGCGLFASALALVFGVIRPWHWLLSSLFGLGSSLTLWAAGVRLTIEGLEHVSLGKAQILVGNHQSALDIPVMARPLRGRIRFMAKDSLYRIPIVGWAMLRYDFIPVARSNPRAVLKHISRMLDALKLRSISYVIFAEGTRSLDGRLLPFRRGVMKICQRAGVDVVPFSIDGTGAVHQRGTFCVKPGPVRLTFAEPIPAERVAAMDNTALMAEVRAAVARGLPSCEPPPEADSSDHATEGKGLVH